MASRTFGSLKGGVSMNMPMVTAVPPGALVRVMLGSSFSVRDRGRIDHQDDIGPAGLQGRRRG